MASLLLTPAGQQSPAEALEMSRRAPTVLDRPSVLSSLVSFPHFGRGESAEKWLALEHLFLACLRTRDDQSARRCLARLTDRFGESNERIMGLKGLYDEAVADDKAALERILRRYKSALDEDPTNSFIAKRMIALLRSLSRPDDAIAALVRLLDSSPTDAEAWSELSELYLRQGLYGQAIFSLEEVLLITPFAWNVHARMGELLYMAASAKESGNAAGGLKMQIDSMRSFCRSVELCDDYLRGYYGLKLVTDKLVQIEPRTLERGGDGNDVAPPSHEDMKRLNGYAAHKLAGIVRRSSGRSSKQDAVEEPDVVAAKELLARDGSDVKR